MKKYITVFIAIIAIKSYSQSPIILLRQTNGQPANNSYIKDTYNDLDTFVGNYLFNENGIYFLIKLRKEIQYFNGFYYEDRLVGDLDYKENNITLLNTIPNFNTTFNFQNPISHNIESNYLLKNHYKPECLDCVADELRLGMTIYDTRNYSRFILKKTIVNGQQALKAVKFTVGPRSLIDGQAPTENIISDREYIFIKQP